MAEEKQVSMLAESQLSTSDDDAQEITWTEEEELALVKRYLPKSCCKGAYMSNNLKARAEHTNKWHSSRQD